MILTKDTAKRATGEKHGARAVFTDKYGFFPHMQSRSGYFDGIGRTASAAEDTAVNITFIGA